MIGWQHNRLSVIPLQNAVKHHIEVNKELLEMLQILSY